MAPSLTKIAPPAVLARLLVKMLVVTVVAAEEIAPP
jgi:hypothetical protein